MKQCTKCKHTKSLDKFNKQTQRKSGLHPWCTLCISNYYQEHREKILANKKLDYQANPEHYKLKAKRWWKRNKDNETLKAKKRAYSKKYYQKSRKTGFLESMKKLFKK